MSDELIKSTELPLVERRPDLFDEAEAFAKASLSKSTRRAIKGDWQVFEEWCAAQRVQAMPASSETAAAFLTEQARTKKVATLMRYRATVGKLHRLKGHPSPFASEHVKAIVAGIRRVKGVVQHRKEPLTLALAGAYQTGRTAIRDRAIVLFGLATSFRGQELCALNVDDLEWVAEGVIVHQRRSKTDQEGAGRAVGVPFLGTDFCPVRALSEWLELLKDEHGPLFRGYLCNGKIGGRRMCPISINLIVKRVAEGANLDPKSFGAHSLRAGYVTEARRAGLDWASIMAQTGHKRVETAQRYDRGTIDPFQASKVERVFTAASKRLEKK